MNRYNRNILIEGLGKEGQEKLGQSSVLVIGAGGLGSPVLLYLAAAGVGCLGIVDYDRVDVSNLQRQILHYTNDVGQEKVRSAREKLTALNPEIRLHTYPEKFSQENAAALVRSYDFVIDCCDNYTTKFLINDICVQEQKPYSHGAVLAMYGEVMTVIPGSACYRCVFPSPPEEGTAAVSSDVGILGAVAGIIGSIQATEAIKYLTGLGELLLNRIFIVDARSMQISSLQVEKNACCYCQT
ncbi:HesA/MoeB/ThiF family protein [Parabacteroides sp. 52]|uniref:HesA/MoeB/ThiF family protein n=1 Tax=unclassified Parabacteroides TaxID=2649774 RepID=UPI0013D37098|nr:MULTISPECIES: HesA/MoeB/ThiF family protein [unclassified Parabacteroides]MDH6533870.1 molybdopterin/thiamine biosynthesis adenylyltransferase [Parabacteroides sp. PM5-20]NDV54615.1 HesA/MoeB/ThiF family protein [Parabacteroides sp. 52]